VNADNDDWFGGFFNRELSRIYRINILVLCTFLLLVDRFSINIVRLCRQVQVHRTGNLLANYSSMLSITKNKNQEPEKPKPLITDLESCLHTCLHSYLYTSLHDSSVKETVFLIRELR